MPWDVKETDRCPVSRPWGVIKQGDDSLEGCHPTKAMALKQQAALYANEPSLSSLPIGDTMSTNLDGTLVRFVPAPNSDLELRDNTGQGPVMAGHFAVFDEWTEINSAWEGTFMERIAPGAFSKTFKENRSNMRVLFQHGRDVLGEQILGPIDVLREDERGAYYEVPLYEGVPPLILNGLRDGQYGSSFRFRVVKEEFDRKAPESEHNPAGLPERTITEAKVMEFGPVTFPAYEGASAGLRSATDWWQSNNVLEALEALKVRAAALESEPEPEPDPEPDPGDEPVPALSRSTRSRDYLRPRKERRSWELP